ncbi:MAG TPA: HlyD family efflux transporter periplasmic adaptor subunit [Candidatus Desulfobacillus sp.]|nr:HlyD family efflux transporter periplasmic adaptor subunit [Candidatus Desulfobacillus sp.]
MSAGPSADDSGRRKRWLAALALVFLAIAAFYGLRWFLHGRLHVATDDAYVGGNLIRITPRVAGTVVAVLADDTGMVEQGQLLVRLDDTDARLALAKAEADLAETVRSIRQSFEQRSQQQANLALRQRAFSQAEADFQRRQAAIAAQAVSKEEAEHAHAARDQAQAELDLARAQLAAADAAIAGTTVATHPAVSQAAARLRAAWLELNRCVIRAPEDGQIAKRSVQVGQQVAQGDTLMALVPMTQLWVEANYKEDQLKGVAIGQPVELTSDLYGSSVVFHGTVAGLSPGTGSVFSLLPPQNASGNWIKIVQRLPVRIALDPQELRQHPLRVGLSMRAEINISTAPGEQGAPPAGYATPVFKDDLEGVDARIANIIAANLDARR